MSERNKAVIRRLYSEVMGQGNMSVADEIFDPDYVDHMPIRETADREGLLKSVQAARRAFPDVQPRIVAEISRRANGSRSRSRPMAEPSRRTTWGCPRRADT